MCLQEIGALTWKRSKKKWLSFLIRRTRKSFGLKAPWSLRYPNVLESKAAHQHYTDMDAWAGTARSLWWQEEDPVCDHGAEGVLEVERDNISSGREQQSSIAQRLACGRPSRWLEIESNFYWLLWVGSSEVDEHVSKIMGHVKVSRVGLGWKLRGASYAHEQLD
jgi:hypothetical protein